MVDRPLQLRDEKTFWQSRKTKIGAMPNPKMRQALRTPTAGDSSRFSVFGDELKRDAVVAPAFSGWLRPVIEDVAVVAAATGAVILGARQDELEIRGGAEYSGNGREKARPACAALVFHRGREQRQITAGAGKNAGALLVV